ncbi:MAG TPA: metal ABC transporter substrate-binding protein [Acidimicrobiales bacterium]|nr:metal ABC transporter substrate-binding protein [Acidimicrobiales bacterium]
MELGPILTLKWDGVGALVLAAAVLAAACGGSSGSAADDGDGPRLVVTTTILGDVVRELVRDEADVQVLMPPGADPHEFALSAREADDMAQADLVVVNGAGFEQGMADVIGSVEDAGAPMFTAADHVELRPFVEEDADEPDPHIWTDPTNMVAVTEALGDRLAAIDGLGEAVARRVGTYIGEIEALDGEIERTLSAVPADDRKLVTNHEVFGYFAERYDFEVIGTVIPSGTTQAEPSSGEVDALAEVIRDAGVPAIFGETTQATTLADALADEVGQVQVVELYTESLGEEGSGADTYLGMMATDADLIADALT